MGVEQAGRVDAGDPAEAGDRRHLTEHVVADHGVGERQHEEVDARGPAGQGAEQEGDERRDGESDHDGEPRIESELEALAGLGDAVADREAGDSDEEVLSERHHPGVTGQEDDR